jgi:hypothetical protein
VAPAFCFFTVPNFAPTSNPDRERPIAMRALVSLEYAAVDSNPSHFFVIGVSLLFLDRAQLLISGFQVQVLPGPPLIFNRLPSSDSAPRQKLCRIPIELFFAR